MESVIITTVSSCAFENHPQKVACLIVWAKDLSTLSHHMDSIKDK